MEKVITQVQARIEYQENCSRQNNIHFKGVPEETYSLFLFGKCVSKNCIQGNGALKTAS